MNHTFSEILIATVYLTSIFLHMTKKNRAAVFLYGVQSFAITVLMMASSWEMGALSFLAIAFLAFAVKVVIAPRYFLKLVDKHQVKFSATTYLNGPLTLIAVTALTALAHTQAMNPLTHLVPENVELLSLALSTMFISLFVMVNRKGALSQMIGILSLENGIVAFALFAGLEQMPALQIGIIFDILIWMVIGTVFISMIFEHFGSLDVTIMKNLKE